MIEISTNADGGHRGWAIDDPVLRLRIWGTDAAFELPKGGGELVIGTAPECGIQLVDPTGWISRRHARLVHDGAVWSLHDLESTNGIRQDGERRLSFQLAPGVEIELGDLTLIAESERLVALRRLLARFLGWDRAFAPDIDRALRAVRDMAALRAALVLRGDGDLTALARRLHRHALGDGRPFVVCEPGDDGAQAFARADAGTLCLLGAKLPRGVARIAAAAQAPGARVRIAICAPSALEAS
ncbi:MAG: FHA domain-containing protein, partial [Kofleriaceae bacterium]